MFTLDNSSMLTVRPKRIVIGPVHFLGPVTLMLTPGTVVEFRDFVTLPWGSRIVVEHERMDEPNRGRL